MARLMREYSTNHLVVLLQRSETCPSDLLGLVSIPNQQQRIVLGTGGDQGFFVGRGRFMTFRGHAAPSPLTTFPPFLITMLKLLNL